MLSSRIKEHSNPTAIKLLEIMMRKSSKLCVALDLTKKSEILEIAQKLGPFICILKTHIDIIEDFDQKLTEYDLDFM